MKNLALVVLFCNKAEQTIEGLENWLQYKYPIYLLNNGSGKEGTKLVKDFVKGNKQVKYFHSRENLGVSGGRNFLIKRVKEDWMFFLDNDITIETKDWDKKLAGLIKKEPETKIFTPLIVNAHLSNKQEVFYRFWIEEDRCGFDAFKEGRSNKISGGASVVHRDIFLKYGLYDERFFVGFEDYEFSLRAIKRQDPLDTLCVPSIKLLHDHKKGCREEDNMYLDVRYSEEKILESYNLVKSIHGLELPDDGVRWSKGRKKAMSTAEEEKKNVTRVLLYANDQSKIGGVETFNENFCKRMSEFYEVSFVIKGGDVDRINKIKQYCHVEYDIGQEFETDICIYAQTWGDRSRRIKADRYIQMIHGDYEWLKETENFKYKRLPIVTDHVACGEHASKQFTKMTGEPCQTIYNLLDKDYKAPKLLKLITVSRVTRYKGFEIMPLFVEKLKEKNIPFQWLVFGDGTINGYMEGVQESLKEHQEVVFMGSRPSPMEWVADADYSVLLSESEGFPYTVYESLQVGTPCIIAPFPSGGELIDDGVNGYIIERDLSNLDVEKLYDKKLKFKFKEKGSEKDWIDFIGEPGEKPPKHTPTTTLNITLKAKRVFFDKEQGKKREKGEIWETSEARAHELITNFSNLVERLV